MNKISPEADKPSAYESVTDNADDEYMGLFAAKTMVCTDLRPTSHTLTGGSNLSARLMRTSSSPVCGPMSGFVPSFISTDHVLAFNLIEIFLLIIPFEWWLSEKRYERLNDIVMTIIYSPLLLITAYLEARAGRQVVKNRSRHEDDADTTEEWEELGPAPSSDGPHANGGEGGGSSEELVNFEADGWAKTVERSKPNVEADTTLLELRELREQVKELAETVKNLKEEKS